MEIVDLMIGGGAGSALGSLTTLWATRRQEKRSDFSELVTKWQNLYDEVQKREQRCEEKLAAMGAKVEVLQREIIDIQRKMP